MPMDTGYGNIAQIIMPKHPPVLVPDFRFQIQIFYFLIVDINRHNNDIMQDIRGLKGSCLLLK